MAPSAFIMPAATASLSSIPGATGTPSPRIEPWTLQDTAARVSEAGPLHGCTVGSGPLVGSGSLDGGGQPAPAAGGWRDGPCPRGSPPDVAAVGLDLTDVAVDPAAPPLDALVPVLPVEDVAAYPSSPRCAADGDAPCPPAGRALVGIASVLDLAWADAKGPAWPPGITPASMAIAWSH